MQNELENKLFTNITTEERKTILTEIDLIKQRTDTGKRIRARIPFVEQGETPNKFFYETELKEQSQNTITELINLNNKTTCDKTEIQKIIYDFYFKLWGEPPKLDSGSLTETVKNVPV